jgi:catechol 2,3-dioxygenase-like lactoylglutathione lyase family enzyme
MKNPVIQRPDHFTIVTDDLEKTESFYTDVLGFDVGPRPDFPVPGLWLYADEKPILHVIGVKTMPEPRRGALDHMAYRGLGFNQALKKLKAAEVEYRIIKTPDPWLQWQVFFEDPNGVEVELDFDGTEPLDPVLNPNAR